jgi:Putative type VII ESX secretion system translocon, EccE
MREPVTYSFPLPEQRQVLGSFTPVQVGGLATAALVAVFGIVRPHPGPAGALVAVAWLVAVAAALLVPVRGRPLTGWSPILGRYLLARLSGRADFRGSAPRFNESSATMTLPVLPPELGKIEVLAYPTPDGELGVAADRRGGLYTAALEVDAPSFLLEDTTTQEELLGRWGALLARATPNGAVVHRLQVLLRSGPQDGGALRDYFEQAHARDLDQASRMIRSYMELLDSISGTTTHHQTYLVVQLSARHAARAIRQAGGGDDGACTALADAIAMLSRELADLGARVHSLVGARHLQGSLRVAFDPDATSELGLLARARPDQGWGSDAPGPLVTQERWDHYRTAACAWHRSYTIVLPLNQVGADWIVPLLVDSGAVTRTIAVTFKGVPRHEANRRVTRSLTGLRAEEQRKLRLGQLATAHDQQREDATVDRMHELAEGHGEVVYAVTITVTTGDLDSLEADCETLRHAAGLAGCELRSLEGQQAQAFGWTLPLARGVD